jgi:hypothetical protein
MKTPALLRVASLMLFSLSTALAAGAQEPAGADADGAPAATLPGAVGGFVVDRRGVPLVGVQVFAVKEDLVRLASLSITEREADEDPGCRVRFASAESATTETDGRFTVRGITPGRYAIVAAPPDVGTDCATAMPIWAPGTISVADATFVTVAAGSTTTGLDVTWPDGLGSLSGTVVDASGAPALDALVMVTPLDPHARWERPLMTSIRSDGTFRVTLVAGEYRITVTAGLRGSASSPRGFTQATAVVESGLPSALALVLEPGLVVTGRVRVATRDDGPLPSVAVAAVVPGEFWDVIGSAVGARVQDGGAFVLDGVHDVPVSIAIVDAPSGWRTARVLVGGRDRLGDAVDASDLAAGDLEVVVTRAGAFITGTVDDARCAAPGRCQVSAIGADRDEWHLFSAAAGDALCDERGRYRLGPFGPGDYLLAAYTSTDRFFKAGLGDVFEQIAAVATKVTISDEQQVLRQRLPLLEDGPAR